MGDRIVNIAIVVMMIASVIVGIKNCGKPRVGASVECHSAYSGYSSGIDCD